MTRQELLSLLRVAESVLWAEATRSTSAMEAHQQIARGLRAAEADDKCPQCGTALVQAEVGRPKRYCAENCRKAAYRERKAS